MQINSETTDKIQITRATSPTICPLPFISTYGTASGALVACCEAQETVLAPANANIADAWNSSAYVKLRQSLLSGEQPELCKKCWKNEAVGLKSNREQAFEDYEMSLLSSEIATCNTNGHMDTLPSFLELKCSNICNLKCRMCHPESSHRIMEDREIIDKYRKGLPWNTSPLKPTLLFDQLKNLNHNQLKDIRVLQFSGGEPLISREQFELTSYIADKYGDNIQLRYSSNLNNLIFEKYNVLDLWKKFRHIHLKISADGIGDVYDYIRVGGSFDLLKSNIEKILNENLVNLDIAIGFTTQSYNIFQLPEFLDFFGQFLHRDRITTHMLYTPTIMCIENTPDDLKNRIIKKLRSSRWNFSDKIQYLENSKTSETTERRWSDFLTYTQEMENKYNIKNGYLQLRDKYLDGH